MAMKNLENSGMLARVGFFPPPVDCGDNDKSEAYNSHQHQIDNTGAVHTLPPFHFSKKKAYHTAKEKESTAKEGGYPMKCSAAYDLAKNQRSGAQIGQVHNFVREEVTIRFHAAHYIETPHAVSR